MIKPSTKPRRERKLTSKQESQNRRAEEAKERRRLREDKLNRTGGVRGRQQQEEALVTQIETTTFALGSSQ